MDQTSHLANTKEKTKDSDDATSTDVTGKGYESDEELDSLLDDTLQDFQDYAAPSAQTKQPDGASAAATPQSNNSAKSKSAADKKPPAPSLFGDLALDENLKQLLQDDSVLKAEFEKLNLAATQAQQSSDGGADAPQDFAETLAQTLQSLSQNAESLQQGDMSDEDLMRTFQESLNFGADGGDEAEGAGFMPMMQNMMSNLLSKDVLYPSLHDLRQKYPDWLSANNGKVPKQQFELYCKQFDVVTKLCEEYESEKPADSQKVKDERFERILDLMTQMQDCGAPPKDIVSDLAPGLEFDSQGQPQLPGMENMEQCSVM